jgi:hypothetical protein
MADNFTRDRFKWLDQVLADPKVTTQAFAVAYVIATRFLNRKTGSAWPAIATLAEHIHKSTRRTQQAVTNLIDRRHLEHRRGGTGKDRKGVPSTYRIVMFDKTKSSDQSADRQDETVSSIEGLTRQERPINGELTGHFRPTDRTESSRLTGRNRPTNPLNEPSGEPFDESISQNSASSSKQKAKVADERFEEFWHQYPRRVARGAARKAWDNALKKATAEEIIAVAMRYAAEREGQDPLYTKHPATWLNQEAWLDDPMPAKWNPATAVIDDLHRRFRNTQSLTAIALGDDE